MFRGQMDLSPSSVLLENRKDVHAPYPQSAPRAPAATHLPILRWATPTHSTRTAMRIARDRTTPFAASYSVSSFRPILSILRAAPSTRPTTSPATATRPVPLRSHP